MRERLTGLWPVRALTLGRVSISALVFAAGSQPDSPAPELLTNGSVSAGRLLVVPQEPAEVTAAAIPAAEFSRGCRIDFRSASGCSFSSSCHSDPLTT